MLASLYIGQKARLQRTFTTEDVKKCNDLTKDFNDVYDGENRIWRKYYEKPVVPGLLAEGLINEVISSRLPGGPCLLLQKELIFLQPVHVGDEIIAELEIIDINEERNWITQKVNCYNSTRSEVIKGQIVLRLF